MFLTKDKYITKDRSRYRITPTPFVYQKEHYDAITAIRRQELEQMKERVLQPVHRPRPGRPRRPPLRTVRQLSGPGHSGRGLPDRAPGYQPGGL